MVLVVPGEGDGRLVVREKGGRGLDGFEDLGEEALKPQCLLHAVGCCYIRP